MIFSSHSVDTKIYKLNDLSQRLVSVENDFIDKRKQVVKIKMESNIKVQLSERDWTIIKSTYQNYNYKE